MRNAVVAALTFALVAVAPLARANGRFPASNAIFFAPNQPEVVLLRTTFGALLSRDGGNTWGWICERAVGLVADEDPMLAFTPDGTLVASTFQGLAVSRDGACNFGFAAGESSGLVFIDLTSRPSAPGTILALASSYAGQDDAGAVLYTSRLFETQDQGRTFAPIGTPLDPTLLGETVDVAPSDATRIYLSAVRNPGASATAVLLTSNDHGVAFDEHPVALTTSEQRAFIASVDPTRADRVYVRTAGAHDAPSRLLVSDDAGKTFRTVFTGMGSLTGFAISEDGKRVYVGGPTDGLHAANAADYRWKKTASIEIGCLKLHDGALWACSTERSGFVLGVSTDEGATFEPKLHFCDVRGPLACGEGTSVHVECSLGGTASNATPPWPVQSALLGCRADGADTAAAADGSTNRPEALSGGGGCAVPTLSPSPLAGLLAACAATFALCRRRLARPLRSRTQPSQGYRGCATRKSSRQRHRQSGGRN